MKNCQARSLPLLCEITKYCAKTEFNNCFIKIQNICILFVLRKKQFLSPSAAVVVVIPMASVSQYDSRRHSDIWRKRVQIFFILTL